MRIEPLPPLQTLIAFEATVRHGSFTRAAAELNLTQSAISRQVAQLEDFLGRALFRREHKKLLLTASGEAYAEAVRATLGHFADSTADIMARNSSHSLALACSSGVAALWLTPLIGGFLEHYPDADISLRVVDSLESLVRAEFNIAVYFLRAAPPSGVTAELIFKESVGAYCSPGYLAGRTLTPEALAKERLLVLEDGQRQWLSWQSWFAAAGLPRVMPTKRLTVSHYPLLVDLAIAGHGVVLGWSPIIDRFVACGDLVPVTEHRVHGEGGYHLLRPAGRYATRIVRQFDAFLNAQV
ncbi:LysR family transcriptional regulator [Pseudomonas putida]|uniref:LysR substrate-binding domain-containing protein n=1 Tax=Pseudomonas putida TaxID=303 RepID=UPI000DB669AE|nr:LysR substrate-binding domain-containing protein [Pseudomonas putida]MBI6940617.1 LysR family transcriptional regulator [Pseudomonas putida]MBI6956815.1 LysR family transcriptional regulator [Pseudomonas putida]PZQ40369.1 MAG: LysR family transcriptional regulator [Pseudomonas putida]